MYVYAGNNPVTYTDPDGNITVKDVTRKFFHATIANPVSVFFAQNGIFPTNPFGFSYDSNAGLYHATFDCWQGSLFKGWLGYNDLYDVGFDIGTSMERAKFPFTTNDGIEYILWAWKGDYLNLGAGCEMGIYVKSVEVNCYANINGHIFTGSFEHYIVDKSLAMNTSVTLTRGNRVIGTFEGLHWWPDLFNPHEQGALANELKAKFSWDFTGREDLLDALKNRWGNFPGWTFEGNTATFEF